MYISICMRHLGQTVEWWFPGNKEKVNGKWLKCYKRRVPGRNADENSVNLTTELIEQQKWLGVYATIHKLDIGKE